MAGIEESPPRKRKNYLPDDPAEYNKRLRTHDLQVKDDQESTNGHQGSEMEENNLSEIEVPEPAKEDPPLSKNQLKKRRRDEAWQAAKDLRKDQRRDKRKAKQARKAEARAVLEEKVAKGDIEEPKLSPEEMKRRHQRPVQVPVTFIMDCDFNELMTEKELISLSAQLTRCYSDNRHSKLRAHLAISSWNGALKTRFETVLTNNHKSWRGVKFMEKDFVGAAAEMDVVMRRSDGGKLVGAFTSLVEDKMELDGQSATLPTEQEETTASVERAPPSEPQKESEPETLPTKQEEATAPDATETEPPSEPQKEDESKTPPTMKEETTAPAGKEPVTPSEPSIVYLTSDSPHTLERLSPNTSYIIGGIVDKNRHKGLCYKRACGKGIPTAKLPIGEYMTMQSRSVLAVNHVVEIMLKWMETGDWGEAFLSVIPKRKEAQLKTKMGLGEDTPKEESVEEDAGPIDEPDSASTKVEAAASE